MDSSKPKKIDILAEECNELKRCKATLDDMYHTCGTLGLAIEHLLRPGNNLGLKSLDAQVKNLKDVLDGQMSIVWELNKNAQEGSENLQMLKDVDDPMIAAEVKFLRHTLLGYIKDLSYVMLEAANTCRGFQLACGLILEFLVDQHSSLV